MTDIGVAQRVLEWMKANGGREPKEYFSFRTEEEIEETARAYDLRLLRSKADNTGLPMAVRRRLQGALGEGWERRNSPRQLPAAAALKYPLELMKHEPASLLPETWQALKDLANALPGKTDASVDVVDMDVHNTVTGSSSSSDPYVTDADLSEYDSSDHISKQGPSDMDRPLAPRRTVADIIRPCKLTWKSPLAEQTGRGSGKPDFPIGAAIVTTKNEDGETVEFGAAKVIMVDLMCDQEVRRGTATIHCDAAQPCYMRGAHTAYCWALLVERKVKAAMVKAGQMPRQRSQRVKLPEGASLRSRDHDIDIYFSRMERGLSGASSGALTALCFLQLLTECRFHEKAVVTGGITFRGKITKVDRPDIKYKGVRQWCGRYVYPVGNQTEMDPILTEMGAGTNTERLFHPVLTMGDVVEAMVTDAGLSKKDCVAFSTDVAGTWLACQVEVNGRWELLQVEACVVPGSGQLCFMGNVPDIVRTEARIAFSWVVRNAKDIMTVVKDKAPDAELLIDWRSKRHTRRHPYADEMLEDGENGIRKQSLDLCFNLGYEVEHMAKPVYSVAMVLLMISLMTGVPLPENKVATNYSFWPRTNCLGPCMEITHELIDGLRASGVQCLALPAAVREENYPGDHPLMLAAGDLLPQKLPRSIWDVIRLAF